MNTPGRFPPDSFGRFRIEALIGSGGMGEVYKAFDPTLQRTIAVKVVRADLLRPEYFVRLLREAQACARLQHPNIVTVHDAGEIDGVMYIAMEYLKGEELGAALRRDDLPVDERIGILIQVLGALQHAHDENVIHRDIKPSNVYRLANGTIKLVDFGLARMPQLETLTADGAIMGTPYYASPEQLKGGVVDHRSDIYSTGALAYHLLSGHRPFEGDYDSVATVILKVITEEPTRIDTPLVYAFPELEAIVARAMAKDPRDRYQSAHQMAAALSDFLEKSRTELAVWRASAAAAPFDQTRVVTTRDAGTRKTMSGPREPWTVDVPTSARRAAEGSGPATLPAAQGDPARDSTSFPESLHVPSPAPRRRTVVLAAAGIGVLLLLTAGPLVRNRQARLFDNGGSKSTGTEKRVVGPENEEPGPPAPRRGTDGTSGPGDRTPPVSISKGTTGAGELPPAHNPAGSPSDSTRTTTTPSTGGDAGGGSVPIDGGSRQLDARELYFGGPPAGTDVASDRVALSSSSANTGLRYRVIQQLSSEKEEDVDPTKTFHTGDAVRFSFESNIDGYLYVVQEGSAGNWNVLFPNPEINSGLNEVKRFEPYRVPGDHDAWFEFDARPGTEQLYVFLSKEPLTKVPGTRAPNLKIETVSASVVEDLKRLASRDLVLKTDRSTTPSVQANYVVSRAAATNAIGTTITLNHER